LTASPTDPNPLPGVGVVEPLLGEPYVRIAIGDGRLADVVAP